MAPKKPRWPSKTWTEPNYEALTVARQSESTISFTVGNGYGGRKVYLDRAEAAEVVAWLMHLLPVSPLASSAGDDKLAKDQPEEVR